MIERSDQSIILSVENVSKSFDGVNAVRKATLMLKKGETRALIGPNGAGKTTLFNLITGEIRADEGIIQLFGTNVTNSPVQVRSALGMNRTYQISNLFLRLTVRENLFLASRDERGKRLIPFFRSWTKDTLTQERVKEIAQVVGLKDKLDTVAMELSHGEQRQLEIGIAIASSPKIILLDEPMAGLSSTERLLISKLISDRLSKKMTVLFIEHDMSTVFNLAQRITVMHEGSIIAEGSPEDIRSNRKVQEVYMLESKTDNNE